MARVARGKGRGRLKREPGKGQGRPKCRLVTEMRRSPVFLPCSSRLLRRCDHVTAVLVAYGALNSASASQALDLGPQRAEKCDVPGIFVTGPISPTSLSGGTVTEGRLRVGLPSHPHELPHVPGVSWRPQPARAATRRPGPQLGRTRRPPQGAPAPKAIVSPPSANIETRSRLVLQSQIFA